MKKNYLLTAYNNQRYLSKPRNAIIGSK